MEEKEYFIIEQPVRHETRIKRSVFIGSLSPVADAGIAEAGLHEIRDEFHDASHNCYAYRIDKNKFRFSDDGEPSGTAGMPILKTIDKYNLLQSLLVVTRYFGGIKLGTGGLLRAYSQCAEETIQKIRLKKFIRYQQMSIHYPYNFTRQVHYIISKYEGIIDDSEFTSGVTSHIRIPGQHQKAFEIELLQSGTGQIQITLKEE
jgi:uncharacterized YigZ family protein